MERGLDDRLMEVKLYLSGYINEKKYIETLESLYKEGECCREELESRITPVKEILEQVECIHQMDSPIERSVLVKKYIQGKTWEVIAEEMNYSLRQIYYIHRKSLEHISKIISMP